MKAVSIRAKQREEQLGSFIEDVEEKNGRFLYWSDKDDDSSILENVILKWFMPVSIWTPLI